MKLNLKNTIMLAKSGKDFLDKINAAENIPEDIPSPETNQAEDIASYEKHYSDERFYGKLTSAAQKAGRKLVYTALLLYHTMKSGETPFAHKATVIGALGYFILPLDAIADILPVIGFTDDATVIGIALATITSSITPEIKRQAKEHLAHWFK